MQNSVFKAEVKAKVIALPAQEWIKSEIPTLTSLALQDSSRRINLLVIFYVGYLFIYLLLFLFFLHFPSGFAEHTEFLMVQTGSLLQ